MPSMMAPSVVEKYPRSQELAAPIAPAQFREFALHLVRRNRHFTIFAFQTLTRYAVALVTLTRRRILAFLITQMRCQFGPSIRSISLILRSFRSPASPSRSSGRSQPSRSSSSNSLDIVILASFCRSMEQISHTQKIGHSPLTANQLIKNLVV